MAIVFAAVVPHSPLLIDSIAKENSALLTKTTTAIATVADTLRLARPDALVVISPHTVTQDGCLTLNIRPDYLLEYEAFGDFSTQQKVQGSPRLANAIKKPFNAERTKIPFAVVTEERLDVGFTTTLPRLLIDQEDLPVVPLGERIKPTAAFTYGQLLRPILLDYPGRIAVVASVNLSHRLSPESPAGFSPRAKSFDARTRLAIQKNEALRLSRTRPETLREVEVCGLSSLLLLLGMLQGGNIRAHELSYEAPFGIGFPVFSFDVT